MKKIYFAHPVSSYDTEEEKQALEDIKRIFPKHEIINPNQATHCSAYKEIGMAYFVSLVSKCDCAICLTFPDGEMGMGVFKEMDKITELDRPAYILRAGIAEVIDIKKIRPLSVQQTIEHRVLYSPLQDRVDKT